ncbi:MAG: alpha/beta hydrolase, partial [Pseudomonadota bacterium]
MTQSATEIEIGQGTDARRIAVRHRAATAAGLPGLVWLGGYRSDMAGTKAVELDRHAGGKGLACTRFDYSGHGESGGEFRHGTISRWLEESLGVFDRFTEGQQILVGSSMGGWIELGMVLELHKRGVRDRIRGVLLLAPAPVFTTDLHEPLLTPQQK